jgi:exodeoxyribonuclease-3
VKIASWNVNSLRVRLQHVLDWLASADADVLAIQETKTKDPDFPVDAFAEAGYQVAFAGQPTYNGVAIVARQPIDATITDLDAFEDEQRRVLGATIGSVRVLNLYVPNGQSVESEKYQYKLSWLNALHDHLERELETHEHCVVLGDFNIAPEDRDVHDPEQWRDKVLCSKPEREALDNILKLGFVDTFRMFEDGDEQFSWWDYRAAAFRRNLGLRIDLILASESLASRCSAAAIDVEPRRLERPSDHTPVIAEFDID